MKKLSLFCLFLISGYTYSQDCKGYYFLQNNKTVEVTVYDKDGKENGKVVHKVSNVTAISNGVSAVINTENFNKKGKSTSTASNTIKCAGGVMMMDIKMGLSKEQQKPYAATAQTDNAFIEYPANLKTGDNLKDAAINLHSNLNGMEQSTEMQTTNRKVLAKETITSPAGTWECYKISYSCKITTKVMSMSIPINVEGTEWFSPGFGIVKTETKYGTTLVTSIQ